MLPGMLLKPHFLQCAACALSPLQRRQIASLCLHAFGEDPWSQYAFMQQAMHVCLLEGQDMLAHALYTPRELTLDAHPPLKTAYIEYVTTSPARRGQGLASWLLGELVQQLVAQGFELAALAPEDSAFYARQGWQRWPGALQIRQQAQLLATPDDDIMLYPLSAASSQLLRQASTDSTITADWREGELW